MKNTSVLDRIKNYAGGLSQKQAQLAKYIIDNYKEAAFMTSTALGKAAGVSEPTVIRFANSLGYSGFPELQSALQERIHNELSLLDRFSKEVEKEIDDVYKEVYEVEVNNINKSLKKISGQKINSVIDLISSKDKLVIVGHRVSSCLAEYASFSFNKIRPGVRLISSWDSYDYNFIKDLDENSVAMVFCFPRYPQNTMSIAQKLHEKNIKIISFTDNILSPIAPLSEVSITLPTKYISFVESFSAVFCLLNAIIIGVANKNKEMTYKYLKRFEDYSEEVNSFVNK